MFIDSDTKLCISLSSKPGKFGATVHNAGYKALGLNYLYKPCTTDNLNAAINGIRALNIRGCSISMPFKESVIDYLDDICEEARVIGSVNTIVNDEGKLKGFNTDVAGILASLQPYKHKELEKILILGAGGAARAIIFALRNLGKTNITLAVRTPEKYRALANKFKLKVCDWPTIFSSDYTCLINATPLGMDVNNQVDIDFSRLPHLKLILDMVVSHNTDVINYAKQKNIQFITGWQVALYQAFKQFDLYTGVSAPTEIMYQAAREIC